MVHARVERTPRVSLHSARLPADVWNHSNCEQGLLPNWLIQASVWPSLGTDHWSVSTLASCYWWPGSAVHQIQSTCFRADTSSCLLEDGWPVGSWARSTTTTSWGNDDSVQTATGPSCSWSHSDINHHQPPPPPPPTQPASILMKYYTPSGAPAGCTIIMITVICLSEAICETSL